MQALLGKASVAKNLVKTRIPTGYGEFTLYLYSEQGKEHLALVIGDVAGRGGVPVRVHSECLTGDVFRSRRCDCGDQLKHTLQYLGRNGLGILIYLRQEGRGIGLRKKLEAYNLQDQGMDTVEANIHLGHQPDERDYGIAARILRDLQVRSIRLITNNPHKVDELTGHGIEVEARIPIEVGQHADNLEYLRSKAEKMAHWLTFRERTPEQHEFAFLDPLIDQLSLVRSAVEGGSFVTLAYAQSLDGRIADGLPASGAAISKQTRALAGYLRAHHDALLVEAAAEPDRLDLGFRLGEGPRLVIVDSLSARPAGWLGLGPETPPPIILTRAGFDPARWAGLAASGAEIVTTGTSTGDGLELEPALRALRERGLRTLLAEGGPELIGNLLKGHLVNYCVVTLTPRIVGGPQATDGFRRSDGQPSLTLTDCRYQPLGSDFVAFGPASYR